MKNVPDRVDWFLLRTVKATGPFAELVFALMVLVFFAMVTGGLLYFGLDRYANAGEPCVVATCVRLSGAPMGKIGVTAFLRRH